MASLSSWKHNQSKYLKVITALSLIAIHDFYLNNPKKSRNTFIPLLPQVRSRLCPSRPHQYRDSLVISTGQLLNLCPLSGLVLTFVGGLGVSYLGWDHNWRDGFLDDVVFRFQSSTTRAISQSDESLREEMLGKLVQAKLLGPSRQVVELKPESLPMRELPPGTTAALYLMYIAFVRPSGIQPASKSTFYEVAKQWKCCLRFRAKTEHSMCLVCQTLKAAIHNASESQLDEFKILLWNRGLGFKGYCILKNNESWISGLCLPLPCSNNFSFRTLRPTPANVMSYFIIILLNGETEKFIGVAGIAVLHMEIYFALLLTALTAQSSISQSTPSTGFQSGQYTKRIIETWFRFLT